MSTESQVLRLRRLIEQQQPIDARHARSIATFLDELDRLPQPLDQTADPTHVTASAIVVGRRGVVLHRHKRLGLWLQPGGHIDDGESPEQAVLREVAEETGLHVAHPDDGAQLVHVDVHPAGGHVHLDLRYLVGGDDADPMPAAGESPDARWFGWNEAVAIADDALVGALRIVAPAHPAQ